MIVGCTCIATPDTNHEGAHAYGEVWSRVMKRDWWPTVVECEAV